MQIKQLAAWGKRAVPKGKTIGIFILILALIIGIFSVRSCVRQIGNAQADVAEKNAIYNELNNRYKHMVGEHKDRLERYEITAESLRTDAEQAKDGLAWRDAEINKLKSEASHETLEILDCLQTYIDPVFVP